MASFGGEHGSISLSLCSLMFDSNIVIASIVDDKGIKMIHRIETIVNDLTKTIITYRRDFHRYAETGWLEVRTASLIARRLDQLGYEVRVGASVLKASERMGLPDPEALKIQYLRALEQGADPEYAELVKNGFTAVVGIIKNGDGPVRAARFDIDAVQVPESNDPGHLPFAEGFASVNPNMMHACGHDAHAAIGLGVAETLARLKDELHGTVKLIFQPAEEGVRGAKAMTASGIVDDVDYMIGGHIGIVPHACGKVSFRLAGFLATTKIDVYYEGKPSHAAGAPERGKNALLAAVTATANIHSISAHSKGRSMVNVGCLNAGTGRNVIPATAFMSLETRGSTSEINEYVKERVLRIVDAAAEMYEVQKKVVFMGESETAVGNQDFIEYAEKIVAGNRHIEAIVSEPILLAGSEDYTCFMKAVQKRGGKALFMLYGTDMKETHHNSAFDIDERSLPIAVTTISWLLLSLNNGMRTAV
ncbi:amidohydrolase [Sediminispirochaeta bajacaliforniensis]|uniref:amidohydrolase n=1 Tax=Sediminispirochaeta bajacaliforniensis TaxID=148 RepID=UPI000366B329|nr:amidohydrolase [Sediminispirochaeta bajacaliforniensis]